MKKISKTSIVFLIIMTLLSFTNMLNLEMNGEVVKPAGLMVIIGVIAFFVTKKSNDSKEEGLDIKSFPGKLKSPKVIILALMPTIMVFVSIFLEKKFMPEVLQHIKERVGFIDKSQIVGTVISLVVLALGEEIALRAFFQKQSTKLMGFIPSIIITSLLFSLGHFAYDEPLIVVIDLVEIFIDSIFYGLVFKETDNAFCSWLSHFLSNLIAVFLFL